MKKINITQLLRTRPHLNGVGQLVKATHAIQRALGVQPVPLPGHPVTPAATDTVAPTVPPRPHWNRPAANDVEDAVVVNRSRPRPAGAPDVQDVGDPPPTAKPQAMPGGTFTRVALQHGHELRHYKLFVPATTARAGAAADQPMPLVVMLHGCTQNPDDFAAGTGMNGVGQQHGFMVMYPEQTQAANTHHCWNWFRTEDQRRGHGEPALLAAMVQDTQRHHSVDPARVYVAGLSAGGAMAAVLGQQYPDVFAAVGVHSGVVAGGAHDVMSAFSAMKNGAKAARTAAKPLQAVPTIVFHGDTDTTVHPRNGEQVLDAALHSHSGVHTDKTVEHGVADRGRAFTRHVHRSQDGMVSAEHWTVHGSGHAWSGGTAAGSYTDPQGPNASAEMWRFFAAHPRRA